MMEFRENFTWTEDHYSWTEDHTTLEEHDVERYNEKAGGFLPKIL